MTLPTNWPPRAPSSIRSIRFYQTGTATSAFSGNAYLFGDQAAAVTFTPLPVVQPGSTATVNVPQTPWGGSNRDATPDPLSNGQVAVPFMMWSNHISVQNNGTGVLEISFDGNNVHGVVASGTTKIYPNRYEAGIAVRGQSGAVPTFVIEAW